MDKYRFFNKAKIDDRLTNELIGIAKGLVADGKVVEAEAEYLQRWLIANSVVSNNPVIATLLHRVNQLLRDGNLDDDEAAELFDTLHNFTGGDTVIGETNKSTTLPLDNPAPHIQFIDRHFCFTGTFAYGTRAECEAAVARLGAITGSLTAKTHYLVIGIYATDSWAHSTYGRKIEKAVEMKGKGLPVLIVGEEHWLQQCNI